MVTGNIVQHFEGMRLSQMRLSSHVTAPTGAGVRSVVLAMAAQKTGCALVMDRTRITGIFTERDITLNVVARPDLWDHPIEEFMTAAPLVIAEGATALDALQEMNGRNIRNLPVVNADGDLLGCVNHYDFVALASAFLAAQAGGPSGDLAPEHTLLFVDLTGLPAREPVLVGPGDSLAGAVDAMVAAGTGLVSIVNDRGVVVGELTEYDLFTKIACRVEDLDDEEVGPWMTEQIAAAAPSTPISDALRLMAELGHRYLVLINETGRALGVLTFKEIAELFEAVFRT